MQIKEEIITSNEIKDSRNGSGLPNFAELDERIWFCQSSDKILKSHGQINVFYRCFVQVQFKGNVEIGNYLKLPAGKFKGFYPCLIVYEQGIYRCQFL